MLIIALDPGLTRRAASIQKNGKCLHDCEIYNIFVVYGILIVDIL